LSGYTPHPDEQSKVKKTSLGAEETVNIKRFDDSQQAIDFVRENDFLVLAGELTDNAISLDLVKSEE
jgi:tRNA G18 (ribose-2'-O)-methylase SpoU